ncbi:MAG: hypothetical protein AAFY64_03010 [Pseudomonadota bacterium]
MTRATYSAWLFGTIGVVGGLIWATFACLTELADVVAPLGVNATVAQNAIIIAAVAVGYLVLSGASARRAATVRGWRSAVAIGLAPVLAISVFNGPLFFADYLPMSDALESVLMYGFGAVTALGVGHCLMGFEKPNA